MTASLSARGVRVVRNGATLLDGIDLDVQAGELVAVLGPNGAGKSTLLGAVAGDFVLSAGSVSINGTPIVNFTPRNLARARAVLPQQITISFPFTVREIVTMGRGPWQDANDDAKVEAAMQRMDVASLASRTYQTLSVGEQSRVSMARVLAQDTPLLLQIGRAHV